MIHFDQNTAVQALGSRYVAKGGVDWFIGSLSGLLVFVNRSDPIKIEYVKNIKHGV